MEARIFPMLSTSPSVQVEISLMLSPLHAKCMHAMQDLNRRMAAANVYTMASGGQPPSFRCYLHAQTDAGPRLLLELLLNQTASSVSLTVKTDEPAAAQPFAAKIKQVLSAF